MKVLIFFVLSQRVAGQLASPAAAVSESRSLPRRLAWGRLAL